MSDHELLQSYARENSQAAFAALVQRHLNLVYSAAQRQVRSPALAEEVAQSVFLDLARSADRLRPGQPLAAWLFLVTRRKAVDVIRRESRRQQREQTAVELAAMKTPSPSWSQVTDVLDEAVEALNDAERTAVLLRFFENRSLREVGDALGVSEDTAQKRVSRALDRLRTQLLRRGVAVSAVGLATDLSAQAIQSAPEALGSAIASATPSPLLPNVSETAGSALPTATSAVVQKSVVALAAAVALGVAVFEAVAIGEQRDELAANRERMAQLEAVSARLRTRQADLVMQVRTAEADLGRARASLEADAEIETAIRGWLARVARLRELVAENAAAHPEFALLTENDWFAAAKDAKLDTPQQMGEAVLKLLHAARANFGRVLHAAIPRYASAHDGRLPTEPAQLAPFAARAVPDAAWARLEMRQRGTLHEVPAGAWILAERSEFARTNDTQLFVTLDRHGTEDVTTVSDRMLRQALRGFAADHEGRLPAVAAELLRYFPEPPTPAALKSFLERPQSEFAPDQLRKLLKSP